MSATVCLTVDVEDWYAGMAVLGHQIPQPEVVQSGLRGLLSILAGSSGSSVTLFCVSNYAPTVRAELLEAVAAGHELASHGPDHGRLPTAPKDLVDWLRRGREELEDLTGCPVRGFRSPRFDVPESMTLSQYRQLVAEAGFEYVSDTSVVGEGSALRELPVLVRGRLPVGGGSWQRFLPRSLVNSSVRSAGPLAVCYYHSYDFGATLPPLRSIRSVREATQLLGRGRIRKSFVQLLNTYGSRACHHVASAV